MLRTLGARWPQVLADSDRLDAIRQNGQRRMGPPGAAAAIAQILAAQLLEIPEQSAEAAAIPTRPESA
jgi:hypothetical protein